MEQALILFFRTAPFSKVRKCKTKNILQHVKRENFSKGNKSSSFLFSTLTGSIEHHYQAQHEAKRHKNLKEYSPVWGFLLVYIYAASKALKNCIILSASISAGVLSPLSTIMDVSAHSCPLQHFQWPFNQVQQLVHQKSAEPKYGTFSLQDEVLGTFVRTIRSS